MGLRTLPSTLETLRFSITLFDLSLNQLAEVPPPVFTLTNLVELQLFGNELTALPEELGALCAHDDLDLTIPGRRGCTTPRSLRKICPIRKEGLTMWSPITQSNVSQDASKDCKDTQNSAGAATWC